MKNVPLSKTGWRTTVAGKSKTRKLNPLVELR
jgi:hypothetical protein